MNLLNEKFQRLLSEKKLHLKIADERDSCTYRARLSILGNHEVDCIISLSKSDLSSVGQIVFNNIFYIDGKMDKLNLLECVNELNLYHGYYYYFGLDLDGRIFARYVTELHHDLDKFFYVLTKGEKIIEHALHILTERYNLFIDNEKGREK